MTRRHWDHPYRPLLMTPIGWRRSWWQPWRKPRPFPLSDAAKSLRDAGIDHQLWMIAQLERQLRTGKRRAWMRKLRVFKRPFRLIASASESPPRYKPRKKNPGPGLDILVLGSVVVIGIATLLV